MSEKLTVDDLVDYLDRFLMTEEQKILHRALRGSVKTVAKGRRRASKENDKKT